jgi:hypothetical protein
VQIKHTAPTNLAEIARAALTYRPTQPHETQIRALADDRRAARHVPCPTLLDAERPGTHAAVEGMRMAAHAAAACRERATGEPCTAKVALHDAMAIVGAYLKAYHEASAR